MQSKLIARHEVRKDNGKGYIRLEQHCNDGCAPHVLAPWEAVANRKDAQRYAKRNAAELVSVQVFQ